MQFLYRLLKFIIILALLIFVGLYYFFDDLKKFALNNAIKVLTDNGQYLAENYTITEKEGFTYLKNLKIKRPDYNLAVKEVKISFPLLFLLDSPINLEIDNFHFDLNHGPKIMIAGKANVNCWYSGKIDIDTQGIELAYNGTKVIKIAGKFDSTKKFNEIDLYQYVANNSKGKIIFGIEQFTKAHFKSIQLPYAGGMISTIPFDLDFKEPKLNKLDLDLQNVQLGSILKLDLFQVDARFSGALSVNPMARTISYVNLRSTTPGRLKLKDAGIVGALEKIQDSPIGAILNMTGKNLLAPIKKTLNILEYSSIQIETQHIANQQDNIKISIYGADQKLYAGKPINLNVNLDIDLNKIIKNYLN
jgi:hypothetical protein